MNLNPKHSDAATLLSKVYDTVLIREWPITHFCIIVHRKTTLLQLCTSTDNKALPAFAAAAANRRPAGHAATNQYLLPTRPTAANPQQQHVMGQTNRQTDGRTPDSCIDPDLLILQAVQRTYNMHTAAHTFACRLVQWPVSAEPVL